MLHVLFFGGKLLFFSASTASLSEALVRAPRARSLVMLAGPGLLSVLLRGILGGL